MVVTKNDIAKVIADRFSLNRKDAVQIVNTVFDEIEGALTKKDEVQITGFGKFTVKKRKSRSDISNPPDPKLHVSFTQSSAMKDRMNEKQ